MCLRSRRRFNEPSTLGIHFSSPHYPTEHHSLCLLSSAEQHWSNPFTENSHHHNFIASDVSLFYLTESVANCNPEPLKRGEHGTSNSEFAHRSFTHLGRSVLPSGFCGVAMADPHATAGDIPANQYLAMRPGCGGCPRPVSTSAGRFRSILTSLDPSCRGISPHFCIVPVPIRRMHPSFFASFISRTENSRLCAN